MEVDYLRLAMLPLTDSLLLTQKANMAVLVVILRYAFRLQLPL